MDVVAIRLNISLSLFRMRITQQLRKPSNWQDFEKLCLLLWRAEWGSDDLKLNGRQGQKQCGVDICGHRGSESGYFGMQCKCKKTGETLRKEEICAEVEKAKEFSPRLRHLIVATTAEKDAEVEEYVRTLDESLRAEGWFSLDIKSWEDIVLLLELHEDVLNHYLDITVEQYDVSVKFVGDAEDFEENVYFIHTDDKTGLQRWLSTIRDKYRYYPLGPTKEAAEINLSYVRIPIILTNLGISPLDDYKLKFWFDEDVSLATTAEKHYSTTNPACGALLSGFDLSINKSIVEYSSRFTLVSKDYIEIPEIYVKPLPGTKQLTLHWELLSRYFHTTGVLNIHLKETVHELKGQTKDGPLEDGIITDCIIFRDRGGTFIVPNLST